MKKKIIHILGASKFGGIVQYLAFLIERQLKDNYQVAILTENEKIKSYFQENFPQVKIVTTKKVYKREISPFYDLWALLRTIKILKGYSIVHTHTSKGGFIGRLAAKITRVPLIIHTAHGFAFHEFSSKKATFFYSFLERLVSYFCDKIILLNKKDYQLAKKFKIGNEKKLALIYNGIDLKKIEKEKPDFSIREKLGLKAGDFLITFVGRLSPQKNPEILIRTMKELVKENNRKICLLLIGEDMGEKEKLLKLIKEFQLDSNVHFLDFIKNPIPLLKASDCFVLPSLWEGLPIALLEAMACSLPVIASNIKGNNEVILDGINGYLFSPNNEKDLKEKIMLLLNNEELRTKIGKQGKETVIKRFSKERFQEETMKIYNFQKESQSKKREKNISPYLNSFAKRTFDILFSLFLLILTLPLFIPVLLIQLFYFKNKAFFTQERRGRNFKIFKIYKFRTMKIDAEKLKREDGSSLYLKNDPRVTKFGRFLREFGLDELPQIFNVLKGEMSIVGPRPDEVLPLELYKDKTKFFAKPGLTSLSIINGRNNLPLNLRNEIESFYCQKASFILDLKIILKTILIILKREGIYNKQEVCDEKCLFINFKGRGVYEKIKYSTGKFRN